MAVYRTSSRLYTFRDEESRYQRPDSFVEIDRPRPKYGAVDMVQVNGVWMTPDDAVKARAA